jgi:hypothetical protein
MYHLFSFQFIFYCLLLLGSLGPRNVDHGTGFNIHISGADLHSIFSSLILVMLRRRDVLDAVHAVDLP